MALSGTTDERGFIRQDAGVSIGAYDPLATPPGGGGGLGWSGSSTTVTSSANPALPGQLVTFTAEVAAAAGTTGTPTGTVMFMDDDIVLGTAPLDDNGNATFTTTSSLPSGSQTITAVYSGDDNFTSSSGVLIQVVSQETDSSLYLSLWSDMPGEPIYLSAVVSGSDGGTPTDTVTFLDGDTVLGAVALDDYGEADFTGPTLTPGSHTFTAIYGGDATYAASDALLTQTFNLATSSTALTANVNPSPAVTFTATVSSNSGIPTGSVTFYENNTPLATVDLDSNGVATYTLSSLANGNHDITAIYDGDGSYSSSAAALSQTFDGMLSGNCFTAPAGNSINGNILDSNGKVIGSFGGWLSEGSYPPTISGTLQEGVTFSNIPLSSSFAWVGSDLVYTFSFSGTASDGSTVSGSGTATYPRGLSGPVTGTFRDLVGNSPGLTSSSLSLTSSANPAWAGQAVTFTAAVTGTNGTPTGSVMFYDGTTVLDTVSVDANGNATLTTSALPLDGQAITAIYSGDNTYASSTATLTQQVVQAATTTSLSSSANPSPSGQAVTFTVTVATVDPDAGTPTGTVSIYNGTTLLGVATLSVVNGQVQATFTTAALALGKHQILAIYSGDNPFADSGAALEQTISS